MKKFRFRLQKVLQIRQSIRDEKKRLLSAANNHLKQQQQMLEVYKQELEQAKLDTGVIRSESLLMVDHYRQRLTSQIAMQILKIDQAKELVDKAIAEYLEAAKDAKSLEMLEQKKKDEYQELYNKDQANFLDEVSMQRFKRQ